jgi:hypothetical protein
MFGRALAGAGGGARAGALLKRTYIFVERIPYLTLENILIPSLALEKKFLPYLTLSETLVPYLVFHHIFHPRCVKPP